MMLDHPRARCYLEVDLAALKNNLQVVKSRLQENTQLIAVLKADAYGLGAPAVGRCLWENGVRMFAVACLDEAFALREALPDAWILCMGETLGGALEKAIEQKIRLTAGSLQADPHFGSYAGDPASCLCTLQGGYRLAPYRL